MSERHPLGGRSVDTLLVDARPVDHPTARQRGIGRYVTGLLRGLVEIDAPVIALYGSDVEAEVLSEAIDGLDLRRWSPQTVREHATVGTWYLATQLMLHPVPLDPIPRVITAAGLPVAAVMYDVIPYRFPDRYQVDPNARRQAQLRAPLARTTDALLAISQFAATTAAHELDYPIDRIGMIGAGVEPQFVPAGIDARPRAHRVLPADVDRYVVAVTGGDERKNTEGLLRAWGLLDPALRATHHLVVATAHSPSVLRRWQAWAADAGVSDRVVFTGTIDDDEMVAILQGARLAVMPSVEEGFGLPVVEAAACGIPAICSDVSSLPEVLDEPRACFDPYDPAAIARAIERALVDDEHRSVLLAAGDRAAARWTWGRVATDTIDALAALGPRWSQRIREPRPGLAFAGPFAGSAAGTGTFDELLVDALQRVADRPVTALVDGSRSTVPTSQEVAAPVERRWPVRGIGRFVKPWDFDDTIAVLGSAPHHDGVVSLVETCPSHLLIHEGALASVAFGSMFTLAGGSKSLVVGSDAAAARVRHAHPCGPPILVAPLPCPATDVPPSVPSSREVLVWDWAASNTDVSLLIDVVARLAELVPDVRVRHLGEAYGASIEDALESIERSNLAARLSWSPHAGPQDWAREVGTARVALHVRSSDGGESSVVVNAAVAAGVPTVTTARSHAPSTPGLRVVEPDVDAIVAALEPPLVDDVAWATASTDALDRARGWTFDDVARELVRWVDEVDHLDPTTIRRVGPLLASPAPHD